MTEQHEPKFLPLRWWYSLESFLVERRTRQLQSNEYQNLTPDQLEMLEWMRARMRFRIFWGAVFLAALGLLVWFALTTPL